MLKTAGRAALPKRAVALESMQLSAVLGFTFAVALPAFARYLASDILPLDLDSLRVSFAEATLANLLGLMLLRRATLFPATKTFDYVIPSYGSAFAAIAVISFALRLDYSRLYVFVSFCLSVVVAYVIGLQVQRRAVRRFYVVPLGDVTIPELSRGSQWTILDRAERPADASAVIVADFRHALGDDWERMLAEAAIDGYAVYHSKTLFELLTGRVKIEHLSENIFGSLIPNLAYRKIKRVGDLLGCLIVLPILALPMFAIAIAVRLDSPGPALFWQERVGFRGRVFRMAKFRTMRVVDAAEDAREAAQTVSDDARITKVGAILRRMRLDELPQAWNVLLGDMSWIGPRPEAVALSRWYNDELPFYAYRHIVRPGISGWAQVNQGHVSDLAAVDKKLSYDFYYIKNFSASLDILITAKTLRTILTGFGSK